MGKLLTIVSSLVLTASLINAETVDIHSGWNLLGTGAQDINVSATFADKDISLVWGYRNIQKDWVAASPNGDYTPEQLVATSSVQEYFQSVPAHMGYWVKSENTQSQAVEIIYVDSLSIEPAPSTPSTLAKKTGQTTSYANYDDGYYQKGATPNYTRDSDIVQDHLTGLMWQDDATPSAMTWTDAGAYCSALTLGGYTDWRLPTRAELQGIADYGRYNPAIDPTFQNTISYFYWSSTAGADGTDDAWYLNFDSGGQNNDNKAYDGYVRCVRAGQ